MPDRRQTTVGGVVGAFEAGVAPATIHKKAPANGGGGDCVDSDVTQRRWLSTARIPAAEEVDDVITVDGAIGVNVSESIASVPARDVCDHIIGIDGAVAVVVEGVVENGNGR